MAKSFSERNGLKKSPMELIQVGSLNRQLKIRIWNTLFQLFERYNGGYNPIKNRIVKDHLIVFGKYYWSEIRGLSLSNLPDYYLGSYAGLYASMEVWFEKEAKWYDVYDFIEAFARMSNDEGKAIINKTLAKGGSGYRLVNDVIVPVSNPMEVEAITGASTSAYSTVNDHIDAAIGLLSDHKSSDYRNVVKEAVSAVESLLMQLLGVKSTLGKMLTPALEKYSYDRELRNGLSKIYGYATNRARHGKDEENPEPISLEEATFILVLCSSFINYLIRLDLKDQLGED